MPAGASRHPTPTPLFSCSFVALAAGCVTELLRQNVSWVTAGAIHGFAIPGAVKVLGLVESPRLVVVFIDARERHQYRGLVFAVPFPGNTAGRRPRQRVRRRADALSLRGIRLRLRIQIAP